MKATNNTKTVLTIITSPLNNKASRQYIAQIRRIATNEFSNIIINEKSCKTQSDLEYYLENTDCKILLIEPTNLKLHKNDQPRNAENNQVCDAVVNMIENNLNHNMWINPYSDKILVLGIGNVGRNIHNQLVDLGYCTCLTGNQHYFNVDFLRQFKMIVNCTKSTDTVELPFGEIIYDVACNFKLSSDSNFINGVKYNCFPSNTQVVSCGVIGKATTRYMLADVSKMILKKEE